MINAEKLRQIVTGVGRAYKLVFGGSTKLNAEARTVLADLARFCHAAQTTTNEREVGRREVWLRITEHLHLSDEELIALYRTRIGE